MRFIRKISLFCLATFLLIGMASVVAEEDFLLPDQAYRISGKALDAERIEVTWDIADGYYLYGSKFRFRSDTADIELGTPSMPPAEVKNDEFFGEVEIYRNQVSIVLPVQRGTGAGDSLALQAKSQGCADAGLCYPPHTQTVQLDLPAAPAPMAEVPNEPESSAASIEPARASALESLASLNQSFGLGAEEDELLSAEDAFRFDAEVGGPNLLKLHWQIAPGTYLYKTKVQLALEGGGETVFGQYELPAGDLKEDTVLPDGSIGDVEVYHGQVEMDVPLLRSRAEAGQVALVAQYQGCAEIGICYPPQTARVELALPETAEVSGLPAVQAAASAPVEAEQAPVSEQDQIAAVLAGGNLWAVVALFFGFGLLLAFTPCVFPMIPILSGIIAGQGGDITMRRAFVLSLVYVLAMALTYTVAGVLAGLFGANIQVAFQNPWILSAFALVFVALALSMFGFYDLQLPSSLQSKLTEMSNRQQGGNLIGVAIMGLLSALIVGPCVAPPLAGALIFIGQTGDAVLGGAALFALSLGMGAPLIAIGTSAGKFLPRAGAWMDAVKAVFGVALLGVAIMLLERILPAAVSMVLWGLLLISSAVYLGALQSLPQDASGWKKLWKGFGLVLFVYGVLMLVGAAAGGKDTVQPLRGLGFGGGAAGADHVVFTRIKTVDDLDRELAVAASAGKPALLDFYADWCVSCKEMERYTFSDPAVIKEMSRFVVLQADVTANDDADKALIQGRFGLPGPPAILFFGAGGEELKGYRVVGFKPADEFVDHLRRAAP